MSLKSIIRNSVYNLFNKKNYKCIIVVLMLLIILFLSLGNYNLVFREGLTLDEELTQIVDAKNDAEGGNKHMQEVDSHYTKEANKRISDNQGLNFKEGMNNCSSNYSNLGVNGNEANIMVNSQCESLNTLKNKNKSILNKSS